MLCLLFLNISATAQIGEKRLKSIWLEKFSRFIEWPASDTTEFFTIGILGKGEINETLQDLYNGRTIKGKPVLILEVDSVSDINQCNILFINSDLEPDLDEILKIVSSKPILTIGDTQGFAKKGLIINFYVENSKVRFEFNVSAAKRSGLSVDFRLLEVAKIVKSS